MGFDNIDKKFNKPKKLGTALLEGPWYWDSGDPEVPYNSVEEMMDILGEGVIAKGWEGGVTRIFYAATMQIVGGEYEDLETREFATEEEAEAWVTTREAELKANEERLECVKP